jgi:hypothetical protein
MLQEAEKSPSTTYLIWNSGQGFLTGAFTNFAQPALEASSGDRQLKKTQMFRLQLIVTSPTNDIHLY